MLAWSALRPTGALWIAGFAGILRVEGRRARVVVPASQLRGSVASALWIDKGRNGLGRP